MSSLPLLVSFPTSQASVRLVAKELGFSAEQLRQALDLYRNGLPPIMDWRVIPFLFGVSPRLIAVMARKSKPYYRIYNIRKASGGTREIEAPKIFLKSVQRWIHQHVFAEDLFHDSVHGFVKNRSIFTNAVPHMKSQNLLAVDIHNFFPNVKRDQVAHIFESKGYPESAAWILSGLCCIEGRLPQGGPTSPALANHVLRSVDEELSRLAAHWGCHYTRYADDIAISGTRRFSRDRDVARIRRVLNQNGFEINPIKSRVTGSGNRQMVAGLVVNDKIQPPRSIRRKWRAKFHQASLAETVSQEEFDELRGISSFVMQYDKPLGTQYLATLGNIRT